MLSKGTGSGESCESSTLAEVIFQCAILNCEKALFWGDRALSMLQKAFVAHFVVRFSKLRKIVRNLIDCVVKLHKIGSS